MIVLLCRNRVKDYGVWKKVFDSCAPEAAEAGRESGVIDGDFHFVEGDEP